jgi:hypothetical protein
LQYIGFEIVDPEIVTALRILIFPVGISFHELVIPGGITIYPVEGECWQSTDDIFSGGFHVYELVIFGGITIYPVEGECWQSADEILPVDSSSMSW